MEERRYGKKEKEKFSFECKCGIIEVEEHRVYETSKGRLCSGCFLRLLEKNEERLKREKEGV